MAVINTLQEREATFASTTGTLTRIDYIAAPAQMLARLTLRRVLARIGIRLELTRSTRRHDRSPAMAVFQTRSEQEEAKEEPTPTRGDPEPPGPRLFGTHPRRAPA